MPSLGEQEGADWPDELSWEDESGYAAYPQDALEDPWWEDYDHWGDDDYADEEDPWWEDSQEFGPRFDVGGEA